jgi:CRP/FNR family transcriptional regulator, cyclic AMP receptor protein
MEMQMMAWLAAALVFMSFFMKTMVPLRMVAMASNLAFISYALMGLHYGVFDKVLPILVLHLALLPLNIVRLRQVSTTIRNVREASGRNQNLEFLIPYMKSESLAAGTVIFRKGDQANHVFMIRRGHVALPEIDKKLGPGDFFGEVGIFADAGHRMLTAVCDDECELLSITREKVIELFYQEPRFGFFIVRAMSGYISELTNGARLIKPPGVGY